MQAEALSRVLFRFSAGYRKDLWRLLVRPLFELPALLCVEEAKSNIEAVKRSCRKSFKRMVGLVPKISNELVELFSGYNLRERGMKLWRDSEEKWCARRQRFVLFRQVLSQKEGDLFAYTPAEAITLINQYARLCPLCDGNIMSPTHLRTHDVLAPTPVDLLKWINGEVRWHKRHLKKLGLVFRRTTALKYYGTLCKSVINQINTIIYRRIEFEPNQ